MLPWSFKSNPVPKGRSSSFRRTTFETMEERIALSSAPMPMGVYSPDYEAMIGLDHVRENYGLTGSGQTVVVIDSGVAYDHEALGGGFGDGYRVVGGYDFAEGDADPYDDGPYGSHGTHVTGILASDESDHLGVAPEVDLVSLRIFDDQGNSDWKWLEDALQWVHDNLNTFENPITTVNLSVGADLTLYSGLPYDGQLEDELAQLKEDGIFISVAAGNGFQSDRDVLAYPAMSESVVAAASADMWGNMSYFSQRDTGVLVAPGQSVLSTVPDYLGDRDGRADDYARFSGTSMAAPYVAGASVLLREAMMSVGMTDIGQDDLYTVLYDTADMISDPMTQQSYHRLNLQKAFESILPGDEHSSAGAADSLGTIVDTLTFSEILNDRWDEDYFQVTASMSGTLRLSAETVASLETRWETVGLEGAALDGQGDLLVDVVGGQTYIFGIASGGEGIGRYTITATMENTEETPSDPPEEQEPRFDWGDPMEVESRLLRDLHVGSSGRTLALRAAHSGIFSVELVGESEGFGLQRVDRTGQVLLPVGNVSETGRLDLHVEQGEEIFLKILPGGQGQGDTIDLRATNLLQQTGTTVTVVDGSGDDRFSLASDGTTHTLVLNGTTYHFDGAQVERFEFISRLGDDAISLSGTAGNDRLSLDPETTVWTSPDFLVQAEGFEQVSFEGRGGRDYATFRDSVGDDIFSASLEEILFRGEGFSQRLTGVRQVSVVADAGGNDSATLQDSQGNDVFMATRRYAMLHGRDYSFRVYQFDTVRAISNAGGFDRASFTDTPDDDLFEATSDRATFSGDGLLSIAEGFDQVAMTSYYGGHDRATLTGSEANETLVFSGKVAQLAGGGFHVSVKNFDHVHSDGGGGNDRAWIFDDVGDDTIEASGDSFGMVDSALEYWGSDFEEVVAQSQRGGKDRAEVGVVDYLLRLIGAWQEG